MRYSQIKQALREAEIIDEVSMSPSSLEKFANSPEAEGHRHDMTSASIIATGVKRGWISFPAKTEAETWVPSPTGPQPPDPLSMIWPES
jgi:hypothetical protein